MLRLVILMLLGTCLSFFSKGQQHFSMEAYLKTATSDQSLELFQAQQQFLESNNYNSPWINRVEFRLGTENADISLNEYRFRLSPSNPYEIKANKNYYKQHIKNINTNYQVALNKALKNRYGLLIEHYFASAHKQVLEENLEVSTELTKQLGTSSLSNIDMTDVINLKSDQTDLLLDLEEVKLQKKEIEYLMALDFSEVVRIDWNQIDMISIEQIKSFLEQRTAGAKPTNLYVKEAEEEMLLKEQLFKIEKAESHGNIGFIQANFDTERGNEFNEHLGFQVGVRLPIVNPDKPKLNRERVELLENKMELDATKLMVDRRAELLNLQLNHLIISFEIITEQIAAAYEINVLTTGEPDVFKIMKLKSYQHDLNVKLAGIEKKIFELFIDYLDIKGFLAQEPLVNYLSSSQELIERQ